MACLARNWSAGARLGRLRTRSLRVHLEIGTKTRVSSRSSAGGRAGDTGKVAVASRVPRVDSRSELCQKVESAGLKVTYVTSFVSLLVPLMYLARLRAQNKDYDPMSEFQIPKWMNWMLEQVMRMEHFLLKTGMSLPVGGSLLVLAQKS